MLTSFGWGGDWTRFRGPNGTGVSDGNEKTPVQWSDEQNLKWKVALPGPGHSCPIVVGDRIFVTCWTGYGLSREEAGDLSELTRHLICVDRPTGKIAWEKVVPAEQPEDRYGGMFAEHGYATHTPVSDGERVYVFFGKSGVFAFDMQGTQLWHADVGSDLDPRRWGSASSPILYEDLVIVPATVESHRLVALNKTTGAEVWSAEAEGFGSTWGSPSLLHVNEERTDIVLAVPYEIWGFNPNTGKLRWFCEALGSNSMCSSVLVNGNMVYAMESGPGGGGSMAVAVDGKGDLTDSIVWTGQSRNRIGTPVLHEGKIYWIAGRIANCADAKTGDQVYQARLTRDNSTVSPDNEGDRGGRGSRRRGGRGQDYASPVIADGKLYYVCRNGEMYVIQLGSEFKQLAMNQFASDNGDFSATPAISDGHLFVRSTNNLYCIEPSP